MRAHRRLYNRKLLPPFMCACISYLHNHASITADATITGLIRSSRESPHVSKPLLQGAAGKGEREDGLKEGMERRGGVAEGLLALLLSPFQPHP